jgi:hypothetical protein
VVPDLWHLLCSTSRMQLLRNACPARPGLLALGDLGELSSHYPQESRLRYPRNVWSHARLLKRVVDNCTTRKKAAEREEE